MNLPPFLLDEWLGQKHTAKPPVEFDLGSSTGPVWTLRELLSLGGDLEELLDAPISYVRSTGTRALIEAVASLEGCDPERHPDHHRRRGSPHADLFRRGCRGANIVLPRPGFPTYDSMAQAFGIEARHYVLRQEAGFRIDPDEIRSLIDGHTSLVLVNSPHNPTGATLSDAEMEGLHDFCAARGVQFLCDQVYHPIYHGPSAHTAARLPHATVLGDFSKALCLSGLRLGWIVEPDAARRNAYLNGRTYFTVCSAAISERLGALALRNREAIYSRACRIAVENLARLDRFFAQRRDRYHFTAPSGGMTAFVRLADASDARAFCVGALERGLLLAPGDCFGMPAYFRIGFAASGDRFGAALDRLAQIEPELTRESRSMSSDCSIQ